MVEVEDVKETPLPLRWKPIGGDSSQEAHLGSKSDGVSFCLSYHPTCYRRGPWRLLVEVCHGRHHLDWGCFDDQDQPLRYYHSEETAKAEANALAAVLLKDRLAVGPLEKDHVAVD